MCYLCLQDFNFEMPIEKGLEKKKKRLLKLKSLLNLAAMMSITESNMDESDRTLCVEKVVELKEEQYQLSQEF